MLPNFTVIRTGVNGGDFRKPGRLGQPLCVRAELGYV